MRTEYLLSTIKTVREAPRVQSELCKITGYCHTTIERHLQGLMKLGVVEVCGTRDQGKKGVRPFVYRWIG